MNAGIGLGLIVGGSLLGLTVAFGLWHRVPEAAALSAMAVLGALVGAGALLVQDEASGADWAVTLLVLGVLTPLHARLVFGRPGPRR